MARIGRFQLVLGVALGASLAFLAFLLARPVGHGSVRLTANLAQLLAPSPAAASCAWAAASGSGRNRRAWPCWPGRPAPGRSGRRPGCGTSPWPGDRRLAAMVGELEHQAFHDGLTNLPNRALFRGRVAHARRRRSQAGTPLALLFIDLDDFKTVNDQLGHAAGDALLVDVAARLETCVRGEDTVARLGGDEFAILLEQASSHEVAVRVAGRILEAMGRRSASRAARSGRGRRRG